jgi:hypothetical protein
LGSYAWISDDFDHTITLDARSSTANGVGQ